MSFYEMDLPVGKGIPLHSHPYAEIFYVISGHTDFLRVDANGEESGCAAVREILWWLQ